ncbi:MAG TPA: hypothetical protein VF549_19095 [Solirubrobacteraceae bacterium]
MSRVGLVATCKRDTVPFVTAADDETRQPLDRHEVRRRLKAARAFAGFATPRACGLPESFLTGEGDDGGVTFAAVDARLARMQPKLDALVGEDPDAGAAA